MNKLWKQTPIILRKCGKEVFKMSFFEQHAHYNDEKFDEDREDAVSYTHLTLPTILRV